MRILYRTRSAPSSRIVYRGAVWWFTGEIARAFPSTGPQSDAGVAVALYERDRGTELTIQRRAWFDFDGNHVHDEVPQA